MNKFESTIELLGNTPLVRLSRLFPDHKVYAKLEYYNPTFSIKARVAMYMVKKYLDEGRIEKDSFVIVPTSGNTGLGISMACHYFGLNAVCVLFDDVPEEKISLLKSYGSNIVICSSSVVSNEKGGYVWMAKKLAEKIPNSLLIDQFSDPSNIEAHYTVTGPEIFKQLSGNISHLFSAIGTGGSISGIGKFLKEKNKNVKIIAVDPVGGLYKNYFHSLPLDYKEHLIQSISDNFVSPNFKKEFVDDIINVKDTDGFKMCHTVLDEEFLMVGTSAGLILEGIKQYLSDNLLPHDQNIVALVPDIGFSYMSTLFGANNINFAEKPSQKTLESLVNKILNE